MKNITILLVLILPFAAFGQRLTVSLSCPDDARTLYLYQMWGENQMLVDSAQQNTTTGKYEFRHSENMPTGLYNVRSGKKNAFIILNDAEKKLELSFCFNNPIQTMKVVRSTENAVYYDFMRVDEGLWKAIGALEAAVVRYPQNEAFFDTLAQKYHRLQNERLTMIDDVQRLYPDSYTAKIVATHRTPFLNAHWNKATRSKVMREDFFYNINMGDTMLLRSDVYIEKAVRYMELYMNPDASYEVLQHELTIAIDKILSACSQNKQVFAFMLEYLTAVAAEYHFNTILEHLSENWMNDDCNDPSEPRLQIRIKNYQKLTIGTQAPSFAVRDRDGKVLTLEDIPAEYVLIIFYVSTCAHCRQMMPHIVEKRRQLSEEKLEIIAISIDENLEDWERYISTNDFEWINVREAKGWDGAVAAAYSIFSTPAMFLLDNPRKIIAKPNDWSELKKVMEKIP
ncbi:MAG: TlpA family protein disulfide reductase [Bacteroidales bacterium]|nr:TlpA family protein disulfide reductase [Bacteroidales bacterium]